MPLTPPAARRNRRSRPSPDFSRAGPSADRIPQARMRVSDLMSCIRCMFTANDLPPVRSRDAATPREIIALSRPLGPQRVRAACRHAAGYPSSRVNAVRSRATSNRRSDDSDAHAVGVQSMAARRGQRRTRTAEYDSFSVADDSARPDAELPVNRRSPLSCSKTFEIRWPLIATLPGLPARRFNVAATGPFPFCCRASDS